MRGKGLLQKVKIYYYSNDHQKVNSLMTSTTKIIIIITTITLIIITTTTMKVDTSKLYQVQRCLVLIFNDKQLKK